MRKIKLKIISLNQATIKLYIKFLIFCFSKLHVPYVMVALPKKVKKITLLKSPHANKKAREQFQIVSYSYLFSLSCEFDPSFLQFLNLNMPKLARMLYSISYL